MSTAQNQPAKKGMTIGKWVLLVIVLIMGSWAIFGPEGRFGNVGAKKEPVNESVTQANFEKISVGMHFDEVEAILGKGWKETSAAGTMQTYVWKAGILKNITIVLDTNRVASKASSGLR